MKQNLLAIDPGMTGGLAVFADGLVTAYPMPKTNRDIWDALEKIQAALGSECFCALENVGQYVSGDAGPSAAKFAAHVGALKMALVGLKIPHELIAPAKWQHAFIGKPNWDPLPKLPNKTKPFTEEYKRIDKERKRIAAKRKLIRKTMIKEKAQGLYPHLDVKLSISDALGILWYIERERSQLLL